MDRNLTACDTTDVRSCILTVQGICIHIWNITRGQSYITMHINRLEIMNQKWSVLNIKCTGQVDLVKNLLNL